MSDAVKTEVYLDFDVEKISEDMDEGSLLAMEKAAKALVADAKRRFMGKTKHGGTGEMAKGFFDFESFYKDGSWVGGVFGGNPGAGEKNWEGSVGGRSHFFEYGRSQPGHGKKHGGPQPVWIRKLLGQPPRMFMRPAKNAIKRKLGGITEKELKAVARKLNRNKKLDKQVMSMVNRIA